MSMQISAESVTRALAEEMSQACAARLGQPATVQPAPAASGNGWIFAAPVSGAVRGRLTLWIEHDAGVALSRRALKLDADPAADAAGALLRELVVFAVGALETKPAAAGITTGELAVTVGAPPPSGQAFDLALSDGTSCRIAVATDLPPAAATAPAATDLRLEAVFDVDLPLVVRFGRAVMPLRALADLGPGSVVDMGRSPDDPVELLVGDRVIARGEVVIVGGNYGVRITELTGAAQASTETEARLS